MGLSDEELKIELMPSDGAIDKVNLPSGNVAANSASNISAFRGGAFNGSAIQTPHVGARPWVLAKSVTVTRPDGTTYTKAVGGTPPSGNAVITNRYDGFISTVLWNPPDPDTGAAGYFENCRTKVTSSTFDINISGNNMTHIFIYFDRIVNQFPKTVIFNKGQSDEATITNDNTVFIYNFSSRNSFTISFADWNETNFVRFTGLFIGLTESYNRRTGLIDLFRGSESIADNVPPTNGVLGQYGSFQVADIRGVIRELEELNLITAETKATLLSSGVVIGKYLFQSWDYDRNGNTIIVEFRDALDKWHDIIVGEFILQTNKTALDLFNLLKSYYTSLNYSADTAYLDTVKLPYELFDSGTLWEKFNEFHDITKTFGSLDKENTYVVARNQ
jgi:hypothetical protein